MSSSESSASERPDFEPCLSPANPVVGTASRRVRRQGRLGVERASPANRVVGSPQRARRGSEGTGENRVEHKLGNNRIEPIPIRIPKRYELTGVSEEEQLCPVCFEVGNRIFTLGSWQLAKHILKEHHTPKCHENAKTVGKLVPRFAVGATTWLCVSLNPNLLQKSLHLNVIYVNFVAGTRVQCRNTRGTDTRMSATKSVGKPLSGWNHLGKMQPKERLKARCSLILHHTLILLSNARSRFPVSRRLTTGAARSNRSCSGITGTQDGGPIG